VGVSDTWDALGSDVTFLRSFIVNSRLLIVFAVLSYLNSFVIIYFAARNECKSRVESLTEREACALTVCDVVLDAVSQTAFLASVVIDPGVY
jgi:hypothetical protein